MYAHIQVSEALICMNVMTGRSEPQSRPVNTFHFIRFSHFMTFNSWRLIALTVQLNISTNQPKSTPLSNNNNAFTFDY